MSGISRNQACPCGSGKRYKHCCGAVSGAEAAPAPAPTRASLPRLMQDALNHQLGGRLNDAHELFEKALEIDPQNFDVLHMLGVVKYQLGQAADGARLIARAIEIAPKEYPPALANLGLCLVAHARKLGMKIGSAEDEEDDANCCYPAFLRRADLPQLPADAPGVSIVVPSYNHARYVRQALQSIFDQSYRNLELIVIDDGSTDDSAAIIKSALESCPFPSRFTARENRGAHQTINEGIARADYPWIAVLNSDDQYAPQRIEWMLRALAGRQAEWGFSGITLIDEDSLPIVPGANRRADLLLVGLEDRYRLPALSAGFSLFNHAVSTGNLFFKKSLWTTLGGFSAQRYIHDWDFCLRALLIAEPVFVDEPLYRYRTHAANTIGESETKASAEADLLIAAWIERLSDGQPIANPVLERCRSYHLKQDWRLMSEAKGHLVGLPRLKKYLARLELL